VNERLRALRERHNSGVTEELLERIGKKKKKDGKDSTLKSLRCIEEKFNQGFEVLIPGDIKRGRPWKIRQLLPRRNRLEKKGKIKDVFVQYANKKGKIFVTSLFLNCSLRTKSFPELEGLEM